VRDLQPCPFQPRKDFPAESLKELSDSIKEQGIVQPLIVRQRKGHLELIAGERRWRAAQLAGLPEVPVIVREADDQAVLELALIENLQRENLNPIEEAEGYAQLMKQFSLTQEEIAGKVGRGRVAVANALRLLKLPMSVQAHVRAGRLSVGHAKAILTLETHAAQDALAERVIAQGLNVRQAEALTSPTRPPQAPHAPAPHTAKPVDTNLGALESRLRERLGTKIHLRYKEGKGALEISFYSDAELERILQILGVSTD
jgi:ParB family chromosome partitioning protein